MIFRSLTYMLTTASQNGGWLPETSRSFHCWQPAPRSMETAPVAGKSRQPSHESPRRRRKKQAPVTLMKQWKEREGQGRETASKESQRSGENANTRKTLTKMPNKTLQCPMDQKHEECWCMRIYNKPMTTQVKLC